MLLVAGNMLPWCKRGFSLIFDISRTSTPIIRHRAANTQQNEQAQEFKLEKSVREMRESVKAFCEVSKVYDE